MMAMTLRSAYSVFAQASIAEFTNALALTAILLWLRFCERALIYVPNSVHRAKSRAVAARSKPVNRVAAAFVVVAWISLATLTIYLIAQL